MGHITYSESGRRSLAALSLSLSLLYRRRGGLVVCVLLFSSSKMSVSSFILRLEALEVEENENDCQAPIGSGRMTSIRFDSSALSCSLSLYIFLLRLAVCPGPDRVAAGGGSGLWLEEKTRGGLASQPGTDGLTD